MRLIYLIILTLLLTTSCNFLKKSIKLDKVIDNKAKIDKIENPAQKKIMLKNLSENLIKIKNITVKKIAPSSNIDYDFCVLADMNVKHGKIECYIYTKDLKLLAKLKNNVTKIDVVGHFGKFFTSFDEYYTKIEIIKCKITIKEKEEIKK
jgi:hypothetical protein